MGKYILRVQLENIMEDPILCEDQGRLTQRSEIQGPEQPVD